MSARRFAATRVVAALFLMLAVACAHGSIGTRSAAAAPASETATVSPVCSLYVVTLTAGLLLHEFNSPSLTTNAKKWPLLMAQARRARAVFEDPRLAPALPRFDALTQALGVVGKKLVAGDRAGAYRALKAAAPDLDAVEAAAKRAHLVCKSGSARLSFG